ncbi:1-acyl-sn-glycerol-3-phosphate acyltransferase [Agromyces atrinae]|uniref:1-acyl-sn-glycerol-3-phosphate acyltransferase n=1 Tax=Agromyces atrinae TaxID=592376 RepID=A0A4Q2M0X4_9MICO|nr:lysophospholipid acyltransferase family protein [Agromyces atrinae]MCI2959064.1 1-acyl-sn-glycerol-3-phosphate acyltransferase [Agromyces atrinae]NYD65709.1 1-acyl-sn-glycerol-3-phosphate acyltransferase [Agromyces atrinae]RXZ85504.1 1-acyl-sn-glycerol-3-phosphate acyltransferase [Agromyces atrinae]
MPPETSADSPRPERRRRSSEKSRPSFFWLLAALVLPILSIGVKYRFHHRDRFPLEGAFVLAPNHFSEIDPIVMGAAAWKLGRAPRFLAKASLFRIPVVGWMLRTSGQIPVERAGSKSHNALRAAEELVEKGRVVIVYPEGSLTRDPDLWPMRGKTGAVRIALERGIPIVPAAHWGTQTLMPRYGKKISFFPRNTIDVAIGEPVDLSDFAGRLDSSALNEATARVMDAIAELLGELRGETPPETRWDPTKHAQTETGRFDG